MFKRFKRRLIIIGIGLACYGVALLVAWCVISRTAYRQARDLLKHSQLIFDAYTDVALDTALLYASDVVVDTFTLERIATQEEIDKLVGHLHLSEMHLVKDTGELAATTHKLDRYGRPHVRLDDCEYCRELMSLFNPSSRVEMVAQKFRPSHVNAKEYVKYAGVLNPVDHHFQLQMGFSESHLRRTLSRAGAFSYQSWIFGRYGHFEAVDTNGDGLADSVKDYGFRIPPEGIFSVEEGPDGLLYRLVFSHVGLVFSAVVPDREFGDQRDSAFVTFHVYSLVILLLFVTFVIIIDIWIVRYTTAREALIAHTAGDLALAHRIQRSAETRADLFFPDDMSFSIETIADPAREVGGDFYDYYKTSDGRIVAMVADVSGKGIPAAMFMLIVRKAMSYFWGVSKDMIETVSAINTYLCTHNDAQMFVTVFFAALDLTTGEVEYVNCGHNRPYLVRVDGSAPERLEGKGGLFLGTFPKAKFKSSFAHMKPGDRLFLFTDGVTEAMNAEHHVYGEERLVKVLSKGPRKLVDAVKRSVQEFTNGFEQSDDATGLSLTWLDGADPKTKDFPVKREAQTDALEFFRSTCLLENDSQKRRFANAIDEMLANVVNYSKAKEVTVEVVNVPGRCRVRITDDGEPYNPMSHDDPQVHHLSIEKRQVGGLGILMTKNLVDCMAYRRVSDCNVLTLIQFETPVKAVTYDFHDIPPPKSTLNRMFLV